MSWPVVSLAEVCELKYGKSLPASSRARGDYQVYGSNGPVGSHTEALTDGPTIVLGRKGSFGEVNFSTKPCWPIDTTYYVDRTATQANIRWLFHLLRTLGLNKLNRAAAVPGLNRDDAYRKRLALPPLEEQRRIAAILDQAEELRAKRRAAIALLDQLPQAIFLEMFGDPEAVKAWKELRISDFCHTGSGGTPSRQAESKYYNGGTIPWVKSGELRESMIYQTEEHITPLALAESSAKMVPDGAILLAMYGATVGRLAILGISAATNQAVCNIVPDPGIADTTYLYHALQRQVPSMISMAAGGAQPNISQNIVKGLLVVLPPVDKQKEFAHIIGALRCTKTVHQASLTELDAFFISLQSSLFESSMATTPRSR